MIRPLLILMICVTGSACVHVESGGSHTFGIDSDFKKMRRGDINYGSVGGALTQETYQIVLRDAETPDAKFIMQYQLIFMAGKESEMIAKDEAKKTLLSRIRYPFAPKGQLLENWTDDELIKAMRFGRISKTKKDDLIWLRFDVTLLLKK